jgi:signal transduction histidine kinase
LVQNDSLIYGGGSGNSSDSIQSRNQTLLDYENNSPRFEFAAGNYENVNKTEYQYQLDGFDRDWSPWTKETKKDYTQLPEGDYAFRVKARNVFRKEGIEAVYRFTVLPPWYRTWWAFGLYGILGIALMYGIVRWRFRAMESEKRRLENLIEERTRQIQLQKELVDQKNTALNERTEQLEKINKIVITINTEIQSAELLDTILEQTKIIRGVDRCAALVWERDSGLFTFNACYGCSLSDLKPIRLTLDEIEERYLKNSEAIDQDIYVAKRVSGRYFEDKFIHLGIPKSMLIMLIRINTKIKGLLVFDNIHNENAFDGRDILLLKNLREHIRSAYIRTQMMEELKYLNEKKNEFLGIAAHDLRNPLTAIMGYVDMILFDIKSGRLTPTDHQQDLETISKVTKQMSQLISDLLDISAIESGKVRLDLHQENLQAIIDDCAKLHRNRAIQKNIRLIVKKDTPLPSVLVDRTRIMEVVDNLLSNAIKYTNPGGEVQMYSAYVGEQITTYINDTGQGLDDNDLKSIFKTYKKLSAKPTGGETSTGLGLAIVKKIVELHGGKVGVQSKKNIGSTFSFSLPVGIK